MVASHVAYHAALTSLPPLRPKISQASLHGAVGASVRPVIDVKTASSALVSGSPKMALSTTRQFPQLSPLNHGPRC